MTILRKRVTLIKAKAGMSSADFDAHWSGPHGELAKELPGLIWYVQNHIVDCLTPPQGRFGEVHGIAELAFQDPERLRGPITGWSRVGELLEDERVFLGDKLTFVTRALSSPPGLHPRRLIATLDQPGEGAHAPDDAALSAATAAISQLVPCHVQAVEPDPGAPADDPEAGPRALLFVELPNDAARDLLQPQGPILRHIEGLGLPTSVYLVAAEAKRVPIDAPG